MECKLILVLCAVVGISMAQLNFTCQTEFANKKSCDDQYIPQCCNTQATTNSPWLTTANLYAQQGQYQGQGPPGQGPPGRGPPRGAPPPLRDCGVTDTQFETARQQADMACGVARSDIKQICSNPTMTDEQEHAIHECAKDLGRQSNDIKCRPGDRDLKDACEQQKCDCVHGKLTAQFAAQCPNAQLEKKCKKGGGPPPFGAPPRDGRGPPMMPGANGAGYPPTTVYTTYQPYVPGRK